MSTRGLSPERARLKGCKLAVSFWGIEEGRESAPPSHVDGNECPILRRCEPVQILLEKQVRRLTLAPDRCETSSVRGRAMHRHRRHYCPCAPGSNRGKTLDDPHAAQMALLWAGHNPSRSQAYPVMEPNGNRNPLPPGRSSSPYGMACSASGSNNRVPGRTPDQQR